MAVTVRRLHRSEAAEGRWGSLTKCGVTKCVTGRRNQVWGSDAKFLNEKGVMTDPYIGEAGPYGKSPYYARDPQSLHQTPTGVDSVFSVPL